MSVTPPEPNAGPAGGFLGPVNTVMGAIFDSVAPAEPEAPAAPRAPEGAPAPAAPAAEPPAADPPAADPPADGAPAAPAADPPAAGATGAPAPVQSAPPVVTADDKTVVETFTKMGEALETRFTESFQQQAIEQAQEDYPHYIEKLSMHPLELVGKELPAIDGSDNVVTLRTPEEVGQWQEAVRTILKRELEASVAEKQQESNEVLDVVYNSIEMFRANPDLVPGSKNYNKALASEFVKLAEPYALRMGGKLTGYSIPVQGLIDRIRAQVSAAAPAAPAAPAKPAAPPAPPQAGIPSKAGTGDGSGEDYSPMWKALGITNVPI